MMSENLAKLLSTLLVNHIDKLTPDIHVGGMEAEKIKQMFVNCNFTSIEYWIDRKLQKVK
jgi:hypothetical protein